MKIISFDLSSACIGVTVSEIDGETIIRVLSAPIMPPNYSPTELGYMHSQKYLPAGRDGTLLNTYWMEGETSISKSEKERRDVEVRTARNNFIKDDISRQISSFIQNVVPELVIAEKNKIFHGILTSVLLGEIMGILEGVAGTYGIPVLKYDVQVARAPHNTSRLVMEYASRHTESELRALPDVAKAALREKMVAKYGAYGFAPQTDDEGDSCVVFDYWFEQIYKKRNEPGRVNNGSTSRRRESRQRRG